MFDHMRRKRLRVTWYSSIGSSPILEIALKSSETWGNLHNVELENDVRAQNAHAHYIFGCVSVVCERALKSSEIGPQAQRLVTKKKSYPSF